MNDSLTGPEAQSGGGPSRRAFLKATGAAALALAAGAAWRGTAQAAGAVGAAVDEVERDGRGMIIDGGLVRLPKQGQLFIANDFHTRYRDFERWLQQSDLVARLGHNEDVFGLVLGDVVDAKPADDEAEADGDWRIIEKIRQIQRGPGGKRLIYLLGNHEHEVMRIYDALKREKALTAQNRAELVRQLYNGESGETYRQFNFIERITDEQFEYLKKLPVGLMCGNGVVCVHAGPSRKAAGPKDLAQMNAQVVQELVWRRPTEERPGERPVEALYDRVDVAEFLKRMDNSRMMIVGHTPLPLLPEGWIKNGLASVGPQCVVMAASYGALPGRKQWLALELAGTYMDAGSLRPDREIRLLK